MPVSARSSAFLDVNEALEEAAESIGVLASSDLKFFAKITLSWVSIVSSSQAMKATTGSLHDPRESSRMLAILLRLATNSVLESRDVSKQLKCFKSLTRSLNYLK